MVFIICLMMIVPYHYRSDLFGKIQDSLVSHGNDMWIIWFAV